VLGGIIHDYECQPAARSAISGPYTLLRWHRQLFRRFWHWRSRATALRHRPPIVAETIALIRQMAADNRTWGAERIRGELLKLHLHVTKSTIQKYPRSARPPRRSGQTWGTCLRNHAKDLWVADFLPVTDLLIRPLSAFFLVELASRRVVHVGVTRHPTDAWVAQQVREATPHTPHPKYLLHDNDSKYGPAFARLAKASGIELVRTAYRAPKENAIIERFLGSVRRKCLDHVLVLGEAHLRRILAAYAVYFNGARPHQGLQQRRPVPPAEAAPRVGPVRTIPVLGGLHHNYQRVA
jgi:transposase InsO family protein